MREILFRGKETFDGEWVEGYYEFGYDAETETPTHYMWVVNHTEKYGEMFMVLPETVGQYTGLTDKHGKKIFEGDIVKFGDILGIINFGFGCYCVKTNKPDWRCRNNPAIDIIFNEYPNEIEVICNIYDNPELLKGDVE